MSDESTLTIRLAGDVMLGRLCDQLMPIHVDDRVERSHAWGLIVSRGGEPLIRKIKQQQHKYAWGDTLPLWSRSASDLRIINLETSVTSTNDPWPDKAFNYRMHPDNIQTLKEANIDYCSLANNHTLDYKEIGLHDTMRTLERAQIAYAGVGLTREAAKKPAILHAKGKVIGCFSFSDHPVYFAATDTREGINFLDIAHLTPSERARVRHDMVKWRQELGIDVIIVSLHWGSNYAWTPPASFTDFAHFLIDECRVDVIHGHSSHHVQGIEIYKSKAIIYGCGDLIDDYAVDDNYRNDLSFIYTLTLDLSPNKIQHHRLRTIHLIPTHCHLMSITTSLTKHDREWLMIKMNKLCKKMGTNIIWNEDGTAIIKCTSDILPPSTPISLSRSLQSLTPTSTSTSRLIMKRSSISEGMRDMSQSSSSSSSSSSPRRHSLSVSPTSTTSTTSTSSSTSTSPIASNSASNTPTSFTSRLSAFLWSNKKDGPMTNEMKPEEKM